MIPFNNWATEALNKLAEGKKNVSGSKEKAMAPFVAAPILLVLFIWLMIPKPRKNRRGGLCKKS